MEKAELQGQKQRNAEHAEKTGARQFSSIKREAIAALRTQTTPQKHHPKQACE